MGVAANEEKKEKMNGTVTTAYCPVCMMTKPLTDFGADKRQPDGRHRWCRSCVSAKRTAQRRKQRADDPIYQERLRRRREAAELKARLILELGNEEMARKKARLLARGDKRWERYKLDPASYEAMLEAGRAHLLRTRMAEPGQRVVVTAGVPFHVPGTTNMLRVEVL